MCIIATFVSWLKRKTSDEIKATPKHEGLQRKTSDEKRGNPKMQGV
jgi:hypothetical protein